MEKQMSADIISGGFESFTESGGFEEIYDTYDSPTLQYFLDHGKALIEELLLSGFENVLDIGTGTGHTAIEIAKQYPGCSVVGIDSSQGMLNVAQTKKNGLTNLDFRLHDWEKLQTMDGDFDIVTSSTGLSFVGNMDNFITSIISKLNNHGRIGFVNFDDDTFDEKSFDPFVSVLIKDAFEMKLVRPKKYTTTDIYNHFVDLIKNYGFKIEKIVNKQFKYTINTVQEWWTIVYKTAMRDIFISGLSNDVMNRFKDYHLGHINSLLNRGDRCYVVNAKIVIGRKI